MAQANDGLRLGVNIVKASYGKVHDETQAIPLLQDQGLHKRTRQAVQFNGPADYTVRKEWVGRPSWIEGWQRDSLLSVINTRVLDVPRDPPHWQSPLQDIRAFRNQRLVPDAKVDDGIGLECHTS